MRDMGSYKCHFKNAKGEDETTGKVTVKPVSSFLITIRYSLKEQLYKFSVYQKFTPLKSCIEMFRSDDLHATFFIGNNQI